MSSKLIVSIDGGGIRGILPLILLRNIQASLSFDLYDLNIQWWGTSTGAIISAGIVEQKGRFGFEQAVQNILDLYEFRSASAIHPQGTSIPERALDQLILSNFGGRNLSEFPELNIVTCRESDLQPVVFNSQQKYPLDLAVKASCAFPGLFPAVNINGTNYVDGFLRAKNPTEISLNHEPITENLVIISLGTGQMRIQDEIEEEVLRVHTDISKLAAENKISYFRLDPKLVESADSMQNTSAKNILNLRKDALRYWEQNEQVFKKLISTLETKYYPDKRSKS